MLTVERRDAVDEAVAAIDLANAVEQVCVEQWWPASGAVSASASASGAAAVAVPAGPVAVCLARPVVAAPSQRARQASMVARVNGLETKSDMPASRALML